MAEQKVKIPFPTPASPMVEGTVVSVSESTEKWSEVTLQDGTVIRIKPNVLSAIRMDGQYDPEGNPVYAIRSAAVITIASAPAHLRKGSPDSKVH